MGRKTSTNAGIRLDAMLSDDMIKFSNKASNPGPKSGWVGKAK